MTDTKPSKAAMRLATVLMNTGCLRENFGCVDCKGELRELAAIIDRETGLAELHEQCRGLVTFLRVQACDHLESGARRVEEGKGLQRHIEWVNRYLNAFGAEGGAV